MNKSDFHKGQTVWVYLIGNAARRIESTDKRIQEWEVITVGRKYITAKPKRGGCEEKFDISNNFIHVYTYGTANYELHLTKEDIYKKIERSNRISYITNFCGWERKKLYKMSDDDLLTVVDILKKYE